QDHRIASIFAWQYTGDTESLGKNHRHVLAAVDGEIDLAVAQGILDFLDEETLAADLRKGRVREFVARGANDDPFARQTGLRAQLRGDRISLEQRELAAARPNAQSHGRLGASGRSLVWR